MIKINLLGVKQKSGSGGSLLLVSYAIVLIVFLGVFAFAYRRVSSNISEASSDVARLEQELKVLRERTEEVSLLEDKKRLLNQKLTVLAKLKRSKFGPVTALDDLNMAVPTSLWLRQIEENDGNLRIRGRALSDQDIALFMSNLKRSEHFYDVELIELRQMYYWRRTGQVAPGPDLEQLRSASPDFKAERRVTRETAVSVDGVIVGRGRGSSAQRQDRGSAHQASQSTSVGERNVKIKEFIIQTRIMYAGKIGLLSEKGAGEAHLSSSSKEKKTTAAQVRRTP